MTITYFSIQTARWVNLIAGTDTPRLRNIEYPPGRVYEFDGDEWSRSKGLIGMFDFGDGNGWYSGCQSWTGPLAWSARGFRLNVDYLHDCRLIDKDKYATELAKQPAPIALHQALKEARNDLVPTHKMVRPYGAELSMLIEYLLAFPLKPNKKGNYGMFRSDRRQKIILHNTPEGIRYEGAWPISENVLNVDYLEECDLLNRADYDLSALSGNYVEALIYALRKKHTDEDVRLTKVAIAPMDNVDDSLFGE